MIDSESGQHGGLEPPTRRTLLEPNEEEEEKQRREEEERKLSPLLINPRSTPDDRV
jgi:hypothetical protein